MARRIVALVLAAGAGSRFGGGKLLASLEGRPVLQHVLDRLADAGLGDVVVVLGGDASAIEEAIDWRRERRVRNPDPGRGLSSSVRIGIEALGDGCRWRRSSCSATSRWCPVEAIRALLDAPPDGATAHRGAGLRRATAGATPCSSAATRSGWSARRPATAASGPVIAAHPELVQRGARRTSPAATRTSTPARTSSPLLETAWARRVRANAEQVDRFADSVGARTITCRSPIGSASILRRSPRRPVAGRPAPARPPGTEEPWLSTSGPGGAGPPLVSRPWRLWSGEVIAVDPSPGHARRAPRGHRCRARHRKRARRRGALAHGRPADPSVQADVAFIAHVGYDVEQIGPFLDAMERSARRLCVAMLMERQPSSIADVCWPPVHGEARVSLPALPEFVELLRARGRDAVDRDAGARAAAVRVPRRARGVPAAPALDRARGARRIGRFRRRARRAHRARIDGWSRRAASVSGRCRSGS